MIRARGSALSSKALAERNQVTQRLQWTPMLLARRQLCLLPFMGWRQEATALPSPKAHRAGSRGAQTLGRGGCGRIIESLRLEKTSKIIKSNHQPTTTIPAKPCPEVQQHWGQGGRVTAGFQLGG